MRLCRFRRLFVRTTIAVIALVLGVLVLVFVEQKRTESDLNVVLSAYLSEGILHDAHDWGSGRGILVVVQREAQQGPWMSKSRWLSVFDSRIKFAESSFVTRCSFVISNLFPTDLHVTLHLPTGVSSVVASRSDLTSGEFQARFPNNLGYIAVSLPGFNANKTEAIFYLDHFCGLCGGGSYVLMRKENGVWRVIDEHGTWVS